MDFSFSKMRTHIQGGSAFKMQTSDAAIVARQVDGEVDAQPSSQTIYAVPSEGNKNDDDLTGSQPPTRGTEDQDGDGSEEMRQPQLRQSRLGQGTSSSRLRARPSCLLTCA